MALIEESKHFNYINNLQNKIKELKEENKQLQKENTKLNKSILNFKREIRNLRGQNNRIPVVSKNIGRYLHVNKPKTNTMTFIKGAPGIIKKTNKLD